MAETTIDIRALLKAGAHFGHRVSRWNPKMRPYIYGARDGIYIIDLIKTAEQLAKALAFVEGIASAGKPILFVATKKHIRDAVKQAAQASGMPYVIERWFGGTLTNFATINKRIKYLKDLESKFESGKLAETHSKRELGEVKEEMAKLNVMYEGLKVLEGPPAALFCADAVTDTIAIKEANSLHIPVVAIVDTNGDPAKVSHVIPANDDAVSTIELISNLIAEAINRAKKLYHPPKGPAEAPAKVLQQPTHEQSLPVEAKPTPKKPAPKAAPTTKATAKAKETKK